MQPTAARTKIYRRMNQMVVDDCVAFSGLSRAQIVLWHKNVVALPDSSFVGGRFLNYVDIIDGDDEIAGAN